jgi:hypothetical protein
MTGGVPLAPIRPCFIGYMLIFNYHAMYNLLIKRQFSYPCRVISSDMT